MISKIIILVSRQLKSNNDEDSNNDDNDNKELSGELCIFAQLIIPNIFS